MTEEAPAKRVKSESTLEQLQQYTVVVADTGDFDSIRKSVPCSGPEGSRWAWACVVEWD